MCPRTAKQQGFEIQFQTNYLSHHLLTRSPLHHPWTSSPASTRPIIPESWTLLRRTLQTRLHLLSLRPHLPKLERSLNVDPLRYLQALVRCWHSQIASYSLPRTSSPCFTPGRWKRDWVLDHEGVILGISSYNRFWKLGAPGPEEGCAGIFSVLSLTRLG